MATNAAKYGALSNEAGRVDINWATEVDQLRFVWTERGGPLVPRERATAGFGSLLAERSVKGHLQGKLLREWFEAGLKVTLLVPLEHLAE